MSKLINNTYIGKSLIHGFGVFASNKAKPGDILMECVVPMELITKNTYMLRTYRMGWKVKGDDYYEDDFIPIGNASCINDCGYKGMQELPNIEWSLDKKNRVFTGYARIDIAKDEEIFFDYQNYHIHKPDEIS